MSFESRIEYRITVPRTPRYLWNTCVFRRIYPRDGKSLDLYPCSYDTLFFLDLVQVNCGNMQTLRSVLVPCLWNSAGQLARRGEGSRLTHRLQDREKIAERWCPPPLGKSRLRPWPYLCHPSPSPAATRYEDVQKHWEVRSTAIPFVTVCLQTYC